MPWCSIAIIAAGRAASSMKTLGPKGLEFLESRGLCGEVGARHGLYTASRKSNEVVPDQDGGIIAFPFFEHNVPVAEKFRGPNKKFWQRPGGRRTFWNADALDDPALADGRLPLVITEGELDALTALECGFPLAVSVPDGAPPVRSGDDPANLEPVDGHADAKGKFEFIWNNRDRLAKVRRFIIAVDNDGPGQRLAAELVRRLFASRCLFVSYPDGCKDLNDVLMKHGRDKAAAVLQEARPYPVRGLYRLGDYPDHKPLETFSTGWETVDRNLRIFPGEFMVVSGIPSHGKSTWTMNLLANLADLYDWRFAVFSPEMPTVPHLRDKLRRMKGQSADPWIERHFVFIDSDPTGVDDEDFDLDWVLDRATDAVLRDNINILLIDPWNEIEHAKMRDETITDYIGRSIRAMKRFARLRSVAVIVVAHPTKEVGKEGKHRTPTLYDIEGSAHWFNKCDHGVIIERPDPNSNGATIWIAKSRFEDAGEKGKILMEFDRVSSRYQMLNSGSEGL